MIRPEQLLKELNIPNSETRAFYIARTPNGGMLDEAFVELGESLHHRGHSMDPFIKVLEAEPSNLAIRLIVLGHFKMLSKMAPEKLASQLEWMIANRPSDYVHERFRYLELPPHLMARLERLWLKQTKMFKSDARVLYNAASFYRGSSEKMEALLKKCKSVNPKHPAATRLLAYSYMSRARTGRSERTRERLAQLAFREADGYLGMIDPLRGERLGLFSVFMRHALEFGEIERARNYANKLKEHEWMYWYYQKSLVCLARVALEDNNTRSVAIRLRQLKQSFKKDPCYNGLTVFSLELAAELLAKNEKELALQCLKSLLSGSRYIETEPERPIKQKDLLDRRSRLRVWIKEIRQGRCPKLEYAKDSVRW